MWLEYTSNCSITLKKSQILLENKKSYNKLSKKHHPKEHNVRNLLKCTFRHCKSIKYKTICSKHIISTCNFLCILNERKTCLLLLFPRISIHPFHDYILFKHTHSSAYRTIILGSRGWLDVNRSTI